MTRPIRGPGWHGRRRRCGPAYVVDLAWLRTTPWRERLAASFDPAAPLPLLCQLSTVAVRHQPSSAASALLLAGWLALAPGLGAGPTAVA